MKNYTPFSKRRLLPQNKVLPFVHPPLQPHDFCGICCLLPKIFSAIMWSHACCQTQSCRNKRGGEFGLKLIAAVSRDTPNSLFLLKNAVYLRSYLLAYSSFMSLC